MLQWQGVFENYAKAFVRKNLWRVCHIMDEADALQECALAFTVCLKYYADKPGMNPAWFMSLYKLALRGDFADFATRDSKRRGLAVPMTDSLERMRENQTEPSCHILAECWASASDDLKLVLSCIGDASNDMLEMMFHNDKPNELNNRLKRFAGIASNSDVVAELQVLLSPANTKELQA